MRFTDETSKMSFRRFGDAQIYYFMHILAENGRLSQYKMSTIMDISKGSVKVIEDILREWKLVAVDRGGIRLTEAGECFLRDIPMELVSTPNTKHVIGRYQQVVLVRGAASKVTNGMYQRDGAIIAGAEGATVFTMENGNLMMPTNWNMDEKDPPFAAEIRRRTGMGESDALVIAGASDIDTAIIAAVSVSLDML